MNRSIEAFLEIGINGVSDNISCGSGSGRGDGSGSGSGRGYSDGDGWGDGRGLGDGDGWGNGHGDGRGSGDGWGNGHGNSRGRGDGWGNGHGNSRGLNEGILKMNGQLVYQIDFVPTIITKVRGNIAKGFILNEDFTTTSCYIVKSENLFAHGETLKEAQKSLESKLFKDMDIDERIDFFVKNFKSDIKYPAKEFYEWHHRLTGSCELGRRNFVQNHNIDFNDTYTVSEFITLVEDSYGSEIIKQLKERYMQT